MERLSSGFSTKISEFENINGNLRRSLVDLKQQNDDLRVQVRLHLNLSLGKLLRLLLKKPLHELKLFKHYNVIRKIEILGKSKHFINPLQLMFEFCKYQKQLCLSHTYTLRIEGILKTGGVAQMVERSLSMREVPGSIPGASITIFFDISIFDTSESSTLY